MVIKTRFSILVYCSLLRMLLLINTNHYVQLSYLVINQPISVWTKMMVQPTDRHFHSLSVAGDVHLWTSTHKLRILLLWSRNHKSSTTVTELSLFSTEYRYHTFTKPHVKSPGLNRRIRSKTVVYSLFWWPALRQTLSLGVGHLSANMLRSNDGMMGR